MDLTAILCIVIPVILIVAIYVFSGRRDQNRRDEVGAAQTAYYQALTALKAKPTDANLRQHALTAGRQYSNLTRNRQGVTVYDEMALMNDINAATAGATPAPATASSPTAAKSVEDRLRNLEGLRTKGLISEQEYEARRQQILNDV